MSREEPNQENQEVSVRVYDGEELRKKREFTFKGRGRRHRGITKLQQNRSVNKPFGKVPSLKRENTIGRVTGCDSGSHS